MVLNSLSAHYSFFQYNRNSAVRMGVGDTVKNPDSLKVDYVSISITSWQAFFGVLARIRGLFSGQPLAYAA